MNQNAAIIKRNDELTSLIVRKRDPICFYPYCNNRSVHNCHIFGRANMATRFNPLACVGGCAEHHHEIDTNPDAKRTLFIGQLGLKKYEELERDANSNCKLLPSDLKDINKRLKEELKSYS